MSTTPTSRSRPASSLSRPSSSLSRPPSSASQRPASSASITRPKSSASSVRPISASSGRPQSRFSQRTQTRHAKSRVNPFAQTLVTQVVGIKEDDDPDTFKKNVDYIVRSLEGTTLSKGAASVDMALVEQQINGHALKARITMKDVLSEALLVAFNKLKTQIEAREKDLDHDIQMTHIPDHLQLLISLSQPPSASTIAYAEQFLGNIRNPRPPSPGLTWKDILAEEPFEGEHWEGVFDSETRDDKGWDTTPSLSPLSSDIEDADSISSLSYEGHRQTRRGTASEPREDKEESPLVGGPSAPGSSIPPHTHVHRKEFEELQAMQYWRTDWKGYVQPSKQFNIGDPSTLGPAFADVLARQQNRLPATQALLQHERYIREEDMVREVYIALQGRKNVVLTWKNNAYMTTSDTPRLAHLTLSSQEAILSSLAETATTLEHLRHFRSSVFALSYGQSPAPSGNPIPSKNITHTVEAFADAIDAEIRAFDTWCADQEAAICSVYISSPTTTSDPYVITSLLHTSKAISDTFEYTFPVLFDIVNKVFSSSLSSSSEFCISYITSGARAPAIVASRLLDVLFANVQVHLEREEVVTSGRLTRVFVKTAQPMWEMCGRWLKDGIGLGLLGGVNSASGRKGIMRTDVLDDEFFVEAKIIEFSGEAHMGLLHPEFWQEAYGLREGVGIEGGQEQAKAVPMFLEHVAEMILRTGKSVGLIRALGSNIDVFGTGSWESFGELVAQSSCGNDATIKNPGSLFSVSVDTLSRLVYTRLLPHCQAVGDLLTKILVEDCGLWRHLESIEDLFLMRRGDAMSHFIDVVFNKMDNKQSWSDLHFLNTAFADVVEANVNAGSREWVQPSLVRFSYRGGKDKERSIYHTVKAIDGLAVEYAVPFPLTYTFQPSVVATYSKTFGFLLQITRAKHVLERILVRGDGRKGVGEGVKVFYAMRSRLSWFINTLLNFLTTYVIHAQVVDFHKKLSEAQSFDDMNQLHDDHLHRIQERCFLKNNTSALHRAIISILDMSLQFSEFFATFTGEAATHDISRHSLIKRHKSRRQRRRRRNVIGFSQPESDDDLSSSSDEDNVSREPRTLRDLAPESEMFSTMTVTGSSEEIAERLDKFSTELDGLVKFIRRGVENLAGGTSEAAPAFATLAFSLQDWDF